MGDQFNQQEEDTSYLLNPRNNEVSQKPLGRSRAENIPIYRPGSLHDDTRVNDIMLDNGMRGGLIKIDPDSEFIGA